MLLLCCIFFRWSRTAFLLYKSHDDAVTAVKKYMDANIEMDGYRLALFLHVDCPQDLVESMFSCASSTFMFCVFSEIIINICFENIYFFRAKLGLEICPISSPSTCPRILPIQQGRNHASKVGRSESGEVRIKGAKCLRFDGETRI